MHQRHAAMRLQIGQCGTSVPVLVILVILIRVLVVAALCTRTKTELVTVKQSALLSLG